MRKLEKFQISTAPYAVRPDTFRVAEKWPTYTQPDGSSRRGETPYYTMTVEAVWFRRKSGVLTAHYGHLWDASSDRPATLFDWLENDWDGRYGGNCRARWDGDSLWAPESSWDQMKEYEELLRPMLDNFPETPAGYDGWWTYRRH
jgi:hypothetical protein